MHRLYYGTLSAAALGAASYGTPAMVSAQTASGEQQDTVFLEQGWTDEQRRNYYHGSQGTAMMPLAFWQNLEQADSEALVSDPEFVQSLGLVPAEPDDTDNPEGLPIGLALRSIDGGVYEGDWVGFTCSSCHNGELYYQGQAIRIDGGSNHIFSMPHFASALREATRATVEDDAKLDRFVERSRNNVDLTREEIVAELEVIGKYLDYFVDRVAGSPYDFGPGRMDANNQIHNTITGVYAQVPENVIMTNAPTKSPFVWNAPQSAWVQWSGTQVRPVFRNLAEALGAMVRVNINPDEGEMFESTVDFPTQYQIENDLKVLSPPVWPEEIFGAIDRDLAAQGKALAEENCSSCHTSYPYRWSGERQKGMRFVENALVPQSYVGTDGMQFQSAALDTQPNYFPGLLRTIVPEPYTGKPAVPAPLIQKTLQQGVADKYIPEMGLTDDEWLDWNNYTLSDEGAPSVPSYKAAPLEGMWSVPPYLHNNSVASIYDLLLPAAERPETWTQGRDFDPKKVGLESEGATGDYVVDTKMIGMSNAGHSFEDAPLGNGVVGRALSEDERWAIVEYIKSLPEETGQYAPYGGPEQPALAWRDQSFFNVANESGYNHAEGDHGGSESGEDNGGADGADAASTGDGDQAADSDNPLADEHSSLSEDQEAAVQRIKDVVIERMQETYDDDEVTKRDAHAKTHGMVKAQLIVEAGLPEELSQGIFAEEKTYDALVRFSSSSQIVTPDLVQQPHGMAIKVLGVDGPKLMEGHEDATTQDFVMINAPIFFMGDLGLYADFFEAQMADQETLAKFAENNPDLIQTIGRLVAEGGDVENVFASQYWSQTPYKYGDQVVKYSAKPLSGASNERPEVVLLDYLRQTMVDTIAENEVRFEFVVQLHKDDETTPIEDPTVPWEPANTQEYRVATLVIPAQDLSSGKDLEVVEGMAFSVWHSIDAHRPIGAINLARREIYNAGAELRRSENEVENTAEPTEMPDF